MNKQPRVLVGCITADKKGYCQERFFEQLRLLTYKNKDIYFVDNSTTNENYKKIIKVGFKATWIPRKDKGDRQVMAESHDVLRQHVLRNGYDLLFHLETDIFLKGNYNIIELLLCHKERVVSGIYDMGEGSERQLCVQLIDNLAKHTMPYPVKNADAAWVDGQLKRVFTAGIGACLIYRSVLEQIKFRIQPNEPSHPDIYFARDLYNLGIEFMADTSLYLEHDNRDWGIYGHDYK